MHRPRSTPLAVVAGLTLALAVPGTAIAGSDDGDGDRKLLASELEGPTGSTIGPDGALYVTEAVAGEVSRIDRRTGETTVVADCLPTRVVGLGGAMDVAFLGGDMYVLTALVSADVGGTAVTGIYRVEDDSCEVVADIGQWAIENPPSGFPFEVPTGVPYAMQPYHGGFLVTDGHHNRVLHVTVDGEVHLLLQLDNVVPTGLDRKDGRVVVALAGPVPHLPEDGEVIAFRAREPEPRVIASGGRLLVDVEFGHEGLYALAQGVFPEDGVPGAPALPDTGKLLRADDGELEAVARRLDRPTSMEIVHGKAYVVTSGEVWRIDLSDDDD